MNGQDLKKEIFTFEITTKINYATSGNGDIPIILLHGFGASLNTWDEIFNNFPDDKYKLYLIDLKGFGLSSKVQDDNYSIKLQSQIINEFIIQKNLEKVILIGHSYGGGVALLTAVDSSCIYKRISKLILIDCAAFNEDIPFFIRYLRTPVLNFCMLNFSSNQYRAKFTLKRLFFDKEKVSKAVIDRYTYSFSQKGTKYSFIQAAKQIFPSNYDELINTYSKINIPTLIIWGRQDPVINLNNGIRLNDSIKNSKLVIIENCGHIPPEEQPKETFNCINEFLKQ